jgi:hypothetical protein
VLGILVRAYIGALQCNRPVALEQEAEGHSMANESSHVAQSSFFIICALVISRKILVSMKTSEIDNAKEEGKWNCWLALRWMKKKMHSPVH